MKVILVFRDQHVEVYEATNYSQHSAIFRIDYVRDNVECTSYIPYNALMSVTIEKGSKCITI